MNLDWRNGVPQPGAVAVVGLAAVLAGCDPHGSKPPEPKAAAPTDTVLAQSQPVQTLQPAGTPPQVVAQIGEEPERVPDSTITNAIRQQIAQDPALSALGIQVATDNGHVVLRGDAPDIETRQRATVLAASTDGVFSVDNRLRVPR